MSESTRRLAVVTGGTGAIGSEICRALIAMDLQVIAVGHPSEAERVEAWREGIDGLGGVVLCELSDIEAAAATFAGFGAVDVLVNGAGITRDARLARMQTEQWRAVLGSNLDSVFAATRAVFPGMCERGYGRIVNVSSVNGQKGQFGQANYSAAKAGMHGFTMAVAQEGARSGVTVNTVSPGYVETPMTAAIKPEVLEKIVAQVPMGRMALPAEIARVIAFLCAPESAYITGANIPVNGGLYMS